MRTLLPKNYLQALALVLLGGTSWGQTTFNYTGTIQTYTVPAGITSINIVAEGAQGGGYVNGGGLGAVMDGDYAVTPGQVLNVVVGQMGLLQVGGNYQNSSGGGGGSFVYTQSNSLLVAAAGGGGMCNYTGSPALHPDAHGKITPNGGANTYNQYFGGVGGNGGDAGLWSSTPCAGGGAGWLTVGGGPYGGQNASGSWAGGAPFCGGGGGGCGGYGGYGGGGGGGNHYGGGGGGGGYSGGGGATDPDHGGGGGSFSSGTNQANIAGVNTGNGVVVITVNCAPTVMTPSLGSLPALNGQCSVNPPIPTATNDCGQTINGTPSTALPITTFGTTTITWTYNDGANSITQTQTVVVTDPVAPVPDAPALSDLYDLCLLGSILAPTATDACTGTITGTTTTVFPITATGLTVITWTYDDGNGNVSTQTQNVINPTFDLTVAQSGAVLTSNESGVSYQWLDCDNGFAELASETNQSFTATALTGNYAVQLYDNGCVDTSACYLVDISGIDELNTTLVNVYPNPSANGQFFVNASIPVESITMQDVLGRKVEMIYNSQNGSIVTKGLQAGNYFLVIQSEGNTVTKEVVVLHD